MHYILWVNDIVVRENNEEYDFLYEMYPEIKELYNKVWYLNKIAKLNNPNFNKVNQLRKEIDKKLKMYGIPTHILFTEEDGKIYEPASGIEFDITKKSLNLRKVDENTVKEHINNLKRSDIEFLINKMPEFKNMISNQKEYSV